MIVSILCLYWAVADLGFVFCYILLKKMENEKQK